MFYSFHCTSLSPPWLIPKCFILFAGYINGIIFVRSSLDCSLLMYKNASDCLLTLYFATLNLSILTVFLVASLYIEYHAVCNQRQFNSFFSTWMPIISFSHLITETRTSTTMLNRNGESCILVLLPILEKKIVFYHLV